MSSHQRTFVAVFAGAALIVCALVIGSRLTSGTSKSSSSEQQNPVSIAEMLRDIPQQGIALGKPDAPLTLVEFADPQCPWCAKWAGEVLPELVQRYVRSGKLRILFQGQTFLDSYASGSTDSERLLRLALAAGRQQRAWNVIELFYANQGAENSGYATDAFLRAIAEAVPGLNVPKALRAAKSSSVVPALKEAQAAFSESGFGGTPSFLLGKTGQEPVTRIEKTVNPSDFADAIEALL